MFFAAQTSVAKDIGCIESLKALPPFERACIIIRHYETLHKPCHWPTIGYGHVVQPGEPYRRGIQLTHAQADALMRRDLHKMCSMFRHLGSDSIIAGVLAYNVGPYRLLGSGKQPKSRLLTKLEQGNRDILSEYLSYNRYKGRPHKGLHRRRLVEYMLLFN